MCCSNTICILQVSISLVLKIDFWITAVHKLSYKKWQMVCACITLLFHLYDSQSATGPAFLPIHTHLHAVLDVIYILLSMLGVCGCREAFRPGLLSCHKRNRQLCSIVLLDNGFDTLTHFYGFLI